MIQSVDVSAGDLEFTADLDFETWHWSSATGDPEGAFPDATPGEPEGSFPVAVHVDGKRYELYSDRTFAEVEGGIG
jgi:hypothetical protein